MIVPTRFSVLTVWLALSVTPTIPAAEAARGSVHGFVSNAATTAYLEGARVEVAGSAESTVTDRDGRFELALPAGERELSVTYLGLSAQAVRVTVPAGERVRRDVKLTSDVYTLEAFTVDAVREGNALAISNPALKPQYSKNFDASVEYYFEPIGLFSAGVFLKEISDFIYTDRSQSIGFGPNNGYEGQYEGFDIITSSNGGFARYRGLELSYQQQFRFLPGLLRGLGANINYSKVDSKGDYGGTVSTTQVAGLIPETANVAVTYLHRGFNARVQWNWRATRLTTISTNPAAIIYEMPKTSTTVKLKYTVTPRLSYFFNMENVFAEPLFRTYFVTEDRVFQVRPTKPKISAGIQGRF